MAAVSCGELLGPGCPADIADVPASEALEKLETGEIRTALETAVAKVSRATAPPPVWDSAVSLTTTSLPQPVIEGATPIAPVRNCSVVRRTQGFGFRLHATHDGTVLISHVTPGWHPHRPY